MACAGYYVHKYEILTVVYKSRTEGNRWHELTQTRFLDDEENRKQKKRDLRHLAYRPV
jgi:hypothetical protein